jgi:hypothetical protein
MKECWWRETACTALKISNRTGEEFEVGRVCSYHMRPKRAESRERLEPPVGGGQSSYLAGVLQYTLQSVSWELIVFEAVDLGSSTIPIRKYWSNIWAEDRRWLCHDEKIDLKNT